MSCLRDSRNESEHTLKKDGCSWVTQFVCVGHVNTAETVQSFDCKWCDSRKFHSTCQRSQKNDPLVNVGEIYCLPAGLSLVFVVSSRWGGQAQDHDASLLLLLLLLLLRFFSNLFVLLWRELLRITSAPLQTTPTPEWEQSVLLCFAIKSSNNHLYAKHISYHLCVCLNIQTSST